MKFKIILIILSIGFFLTINRTLGSPDEEIDKLLAEYQARKEICESIKCQNLELEEAVKCLQEARRCLDELQKELSLWSDQKLTEVQDKLSQLEKEKNTLRNQVNYLLAQVEKTEIETRVTQERINFLNLEISRREGEIENIKKDIEKIKNEIENLKEKLARGVRTIYEYDSYSLFEITFLKASVSDFFSEVVFLENTQRQIAQNLNTMRSHKEKLEEKKMDLEKELKELQATREEVSLKIEDLNKNIAELEGIKREKIVLLEITKGDEEEYQRLLAKIEAQKKELLGDLAALSRARQAEIEALVQQYGGRAEGALFGNPYYFSQDYGPWAESYINNIPPPLGGTMRQYGCAITSAAMVLKYYGKNITPDLLAQNSNLFDGILIKFWELSSYGISCLVGCSSTDDGNINWQVVDSYLNGGKPVILMIKTNAGSTHFVVAIGKIKEKYMVYDPIYAVSQGKAVDLNASIENIKAYPGVLDATVTRMVLFGI